MSIVILARSGTPGSNVLMRHAVLVIILAIAAATPSLEAATVAASDHAAPEPATDRAYAEYMATVLDDMQTSAAPEQRVFALLYGPTLRSAEKITTTTPAAGRALAALADANPDNAKIQWMMAAANAPDQVSPDAKASAIARLQASETDNAAAWALSLSADAKSGGDESMDATLERMAASTRYDSHLHYAGSVLLDAERLHPLSAEILALMSKKPDEAVNQDAAMKVAAMSITAATMAVPIDAFKACKPPKGESLSKFRQDACVAIGRLLVHRSTDIISVGFGRGILRKLDALDAADAERFRQVWWWNGLIVADMNENAISEELGDYYATGNEIEAARKAAQKKGRPEPPADWSPESGS